MEYPTGSENLEMIKELILILKKRGIFILTGNILTSEQKRICEAIYVKGGVPTIEQLSKELFIDIVALTSMFRILRYELEDIENVTANLTESMQQRYIISLEISMLIKQFSTIQLAGRLSSLPYDYLEDINNSIKGKY